MTAPDSVERVVAEMRIPHEGGWDNDDVAALADRLQALARGPQQAGGEDVERLARWLDAKYARHREDEDQEAATMLRVLQARRVYVEGGNVMLQRTVADLRDRAEAAEAALREAGRPVGYVYSEIVDVEGTEPVRIKRAALQGEYAQSLPNGTALYAALNGGQDDG